MDLSIEHQKIELIQWLSTLTDASVIEELIKLRKVEQTNWWAEISSEEKISIKKGIADAEAGNLHEHSEAKKLYGKWL